MTAHGAALLYAALLGDVDGVDLGVRLQPATAGGRPVSTGLYVRHGRDERLGGLRRRRRRLSARMFTT